MSTQGFEPHVSEKEAITPPLNHSAKTIQCSIKLILHPLITIRAFNNSEVRDTSTLQRRDHKLATKDKEKVTETSVVSDTRRVF